MDINFISNKYIFFYLLMVYVLSKKGFLKNDFNFKLILYELLEIKLSFNNLM
jgi:hypothetical protein